MTVEDWAELPEDVPGELLAVAAAARFGRTSGVGSAEGLPDTTGGAR